jgi:hypothetical protein
MRLSISLLVAVGCSEYEVTSQGSAALGDIEAGEPVIEVSPKVIDFGTLDVGGDAALPQTITVTNVGDAPLTIERYSMADEDSPFELGPIGASYFAAGEATTFTITYTAVNEVKWDTQVLIESDDPNTPVEIVQVLADGVAPNIELTPTSYDFGSTYVGCAMDRPLTLANTGDADLVVTAISYIEQKDDGTLPDQLSLVLDGLPALPWTISPLDSLQVPVRYNPLVADLGVSGTVSVESNDPDEPVASATQEGVATLFGDNQDVFTQPIRSSADILFVVDNSGSMAEEQSNLTSNFSSFISVIAGAESDYHIAVITTDQSTLRGEVLDSSTDDIETEFVAQATPGTMGSGDERGLEMAYDCLQEDADCGPGSEFFREDAKLSIVVVSDEHDGSVSPAYADAVVYFWSLKDDPDNAVVHAIAGDSPSGCGGGTAEYGSGYYEAAALTGGLFLSICATDWASHLESLAEAAAVDRSTFDLTERPVEGTIVVTVDGIEQTDGWVYNAGGNEIDFDDEHIPPGGSTIVIDYALYPDDCEQ